MKKSWFKYVVLIVTLVTTVACNFTGIFPTAVDVSSGKTYKVVPIFHDLNDPYPRGFELIEQNPLTKNEISSLLKDWGMKADDQVEIVHLDANAKIEGGKVKISNLVVGSSVIASVGGGKGGGLASLAPAPGCDPQKARAFAVHMAKRMTVDAWTGTYLASLLGDLADGKVSPNILATSTDMTRTVIKTTYLGKQLLIIIDKNIGNTLWSENNAARVTSFLKGLNKRPADSVKGIQVVGEVVNFFKCVRDNWPKDTKSLEQAKKDHEKVYSREPGQIPADFPDSIPVGKKEFSLVDLRNGASTKSDSLLRNMSDDELMFYMSIGVVAVAVTAAPEVAIPSGLIWVSQYAR